MPGYWLFVGAQAAIVWLGYGAFEYFYGDSGCGGPDVQIPNCR